MIVDLYKKLPSLLLCHRVMCLLILLGIGLFAPQDARAVSAVADILTNVCRPEIQNNLTASPPGITKPVVVCMTAVVNGIGSTLVTDVVNRVRETVGALMVLAVAVISLRIMVGSMQKDLTKELSILLLKIGVVSYFALGTNFVSIKNDIISSTSAITNAALEVLPFEVASGRTQSFLSGTGGGKLNEVDPMDPAENLDSNPSGIDLTVPTNQIPGGNIWLFVDQMIRTMMGFSGDASFGEAAGDIGMRAMFAFVVLALLLLLGPIGLWVVMIALSAFLMVFFSLAMAVYMYIASLFALLFLTALGPMIIPLMLFRSWGMPIFSAWVKQVISYAMQPMILTVFFVFMINIILSIVYDLDTLYLDAYNTMNDPSKRQSITLAETTDMQVREEDTGESESWGGTIYRWSGAKYVVDNTVGAAASYVKGKIQSLVSLPFLDWGWQRVKEFAVTMLLAFVTMMVMFTFQKQLPSMVTELVGVGDSQISKLSETVQIGVTDEKGKVNNMNLVDGLGALSQQKLGGLLGKAGGMRSSIMGKMGGGGG